MFLILGPRSFALIPVSLQQNRRSFFFMAVVGLCLAWPSSRHSPCSADRASAGFAAHLGIDQWNLSVLVERVMAIEIILVIARVL